MRNKLRGKISQIASEVLGVVGAIEYYVGLLFVA